MTKSLKLNNVSDIPVFRELFSGSSEYFNGVEDLKVKISSMLGDTDKRLSLKNSGLKMAKKYSWSSSAEIINAEISEI